MTGAGTTPPPARTPAQQAAVDELAPYLAAMAVPGFLSLPAEVLTPVARRLRGRTGAAPHATQP